MSDHDDFADDGGRFDRFDMRWAFGFGIGTGILGGAVIGAVLMALWVAW